jgi:hypothetical protein
MERGAKHRHRNDSRFRNDGGAGHVGARRVLAATCTGDVAVPRPALNSESQIVD